MSDLKNTEATVEHFEAYSAAYLALICNAAIINGVQPPMMVSDSTRAKVELPGNFAALSNAYQAVSSHQWAVESYEKIMIVDPKDYNDPEKAASILKEYCEVFFAYGIEKFSRSFK